jgi:tetratricopeptide (TPR) repeat protein
MQVSPMRIPNGTPVGPYHVISQLGSGGMGEVYRARDPRLSREVALKVIRRLLSVGADAQDETLDRLLREAILASALNHPNIVTIYETGVFDADRYIAMELIEGSTLRQIAQQGLPVARALGLARQVSEALAVAHAAQIVHRDIKPDNVMVRPDGYVKLLDFGLAKVQPEMLGLQPAAQTTEAGVLLGTLAYMAPEQARGDLITQEADVFALGVMLYELVTGRHPFLQSSQLATLHALMWESPEPPSFVNHELPRAIDQLIVEMLQKDPRLRPGASEVMYRLNLAHDSTVAVALSAITVTQAQRSPARDIVGRDQELDALQQEFERSHRGQGRLVVVSAEAGMGKTTLVETFLKQLEQRQEPVRIGRGRCSERLAGTEAYLPILEALDSLQKNEQLGSISRLIRAVAPTWYVQIMPPSENDSSAARLAAETASGSQERLKRELAALFEEIGRMQPVVLCLDDMHWADASTTDLLAYLARRIDSTRLLIITTCRPSELAQSRHPFLPVKLDLIARGMCRDLRPGSLDLMSIAKYIAIQFPEHGFPSDFARLVHERSEGNPLFMADLLRDLRRRQQVQQRDGRWVLAETLSTVERELPESIRSAVLRKVEALDDADRRLLGAASVQGIDFDSGMIAAALQLPEEEVEDRLDRLEREHALVRFADEHEARDRSLTLRYRFAHQLYHAAFYDGLRGTRRAALSRAIGERLVQRLGDDVSESAASLAVLFETARDSIRAAHFWNKAAQAASRLHAHDETARLARRGLDLLAQEPDSPARAGAELDLQITYGLALKTGRGYAIPEVGAAYARARALCRQVQDPARVVPVLIGLAAHHIVAGEITTSRDVALEMLQLFERLGDPNLKMMGNWSLGAALFHLGDLEQAHTHLGRGLELYDPAFHRARVWETGIEPGIFCRCEYSRTLTNRGFPDQGLAAVREAVMQARALDHPQPLAFALLFEIFVHLARRNPREIQRTYEELAAVCHAHGIAQEVQWAAPLCGRALLELGDVKRGLRVMEEGLAAHTITRSALLRPYYFVLLAGAYLRVKEYARAQRALDDAHAVAVATSQNAYACEQFRLQAELLLATGRTDEAEQNFREALTTARTQGARWLELRAARGYASFQAATRRTDEAIETLRPAVNQITEGRDTLDYVYAETLLETLRDRRNQEPNPEPGIEPGTQAPGTSEPVSF